MAQTLKLDIVVDDHGAVRQLQQVDGALEGLVDTTKRADQATGQLGDAQQQTTAATGQAGEATNALVGALGRYLTGAAVIGAIKSSLDYAASLEKMSAATSISSEGLQELENIAAASNTSIQFLTSAVLDLQRRLATGDDSAVAALKELGINLEQFMALKGDQQFLIIGRALGSMTDDVERNKLAFELFGRTYKELLPSLVSNVDALKNSVHVMSDDNVQKLAALESRLGQFYLNAKRWLLELTVAAADFMQAIAGFGVTGISNKILGIPQGGLSPSGATSRTFGDFELPPAEPIPVHEMGGPTREGLAYLHNDEYVVPKGGALVKSGGSGSGRPIVVNVNYPVMNDPRAAEELGRIVDAAVSQRLATAGGL